MDDVYLSFKDTGREGSMATGHYLSDAARSLGVDLNCDCESGEPKKGCVRILKGSAFLSKPTDLEKEILSASERKGRQRLACQVKIERPGEIELAVLNVKEEDKQSEPEPTSESYKKEFAELPLDQKIKQLVELEAMALGDTLSYIMNSPYEAVGGVMSYLAGFGRKMEEEDRKSKVPDEHQEGSGEAGVNGNSADKENGGSGDKETTDSGSDSSNGSEGGKSEEE